MSLKERRKQFLDDTVKYYGEDPDGRRAFVTDDSLLHRIHRKDKSHCRYRTEDGRKCAIGRHIPDDKYQEIFEGKQISHETNIILDALPTSIATLGKSFLLSVQHLHDCEEYWDKKGLSELGAQKRNVIITQYIDSK